MTDSPKQPPTGTPPDVPRQGVPPRRSSMRKTESTRRTPPQTSNESLHEDTPRKRIESPSGISGKQRVSVSDGQEGVATLKSNGEPHQKKSAHPPRKIGASPLSSQESLGNLDSAGARRRESNEPIRHGTGEEQSSRQPSVEQRASREEEVPISPSQGARDAPRSSVETDSVALGVSGDTPMVVKKAEDTRVMATDKPSTRRKEAGPRSHRLSAADEKIIASSQRVERLEKMLLVPARATTHSYLPSLDNPADLRKFVEGELALSIYRRLENLAKSTGLGTKSADVQLNPFWVEPSNRDKNEKVLKLIYELLFGMTDEEKSNESLLREKTVKIEETFKEFNPDVSSSWAQTVLTEMSRLRSQSQMLAWIGGIMQKRCRTAVLNLDSRVNKLQYSLEGPLNHARIMEGWTEIESRKTYVLENEDVIRFITDQCRRIDEMNTVSVSHVVPSKDNLNELRARLDKLQGEVSIISKAVADFDQQLLAISTKIQKVNQLFTSIVLEMAA